MLIDFLNSILALKSPIVDVTYDSQEKLSPVHVIAVLDLEYKDEANSNKYIHDVRLVDVF